MEPALAANLRNGLAVTMQLKECHRLGTDWR
jgi:hypothetical protein